MQLNVLSELRQRVGSVTSYEVSESAIRLDETELKDLSGSLSLLRTDQGLLASLRAGALMRERCARCLVISDCPVEIQFEEEFVPLLDANTGARIHTSAVDDEGFQIGADFVLDLREALRQYVLISEPLKPLCRPDCAGLCPSCGANLNEGPCECAPSADGRWSVLAGFNAPNRKGS